jgi:hypothetical protein
MFTRQRSLAIVALTSSVLGLCATPALADHHQKTTTVRTPFGTCTYDYGQAYNAQHAYVQGANEACDAFKFGVRHQYWINEYQGIKGWTNWTWGAQDQNVVDDADQAIYIQADATAVYGN